MICVSLQNKSLEEILQIALDTQVEMIEVRLDLCPLSTVEITELVEVCEKPLLISWHTPALEANNISKAAVETKTMSADTYKASLNAELEAKKTSANMHMQSKTELEGHWEKVELAYKAAIEAGVAFVDLDIAAPAALSQLIQRLCKQNGTRLIRSFHDFEKTPDSNLLTQTILRSFRYGADIAKAACLANSPEDVMRMQELYTSLPCEHPEINPGQLLLLSMGELGTQTRVDVLKKGAPFSFASYDGESAPGQLAYKEMGSLVYGGFKKAKALDFVAPCSKSYAQRAIIAATLAEGESILNGFGPCDDTLNALRVAKSLGAEIWWSSEKKIVSLKDIEKIKPGSTVRIKGIGPVGEKSLDIQEINVGESGLLTRLLIPLSAVLSKNDVRIKGEGTLLRRPLNGANDIMASFGVLLQNETPHKEVHVPLKIKGGLFPGVAEISGSAGSQLISGLLMSLPLCSKNSNIFINEPKSIPYMFITQDIASQFGVKFHSELEGGDEFIQSQDWNDCTGIRFKIKGGMQYKATTLDLEGDWSAAAYFLAYGALYGESEVKGLNPQSLQADISILNVLADAGACVSYDKNEVNVKRGPLMGFECDLNNAPDIIPLTCLIAAFCQGKSIIGGMNRLRSKESDRTQAICQTLSKMGVAHELNGDQIIIQGENLSSRILNHRLLKGGEYSSFHDHRIVMLLAIAQKGTDSEIIIDDRACVSKSFPNFFEEFNTKTQNLSFIEEGK